MPTGKKWTFAGAVAVAVAVAVHFTAGGVGVLWPAEQVVSHVRVKQGRLAGLVKTASGGSTYLSFQGIPYATPPVGELRFKAPREAQPWQGELEAFRDGSSCMQVRDTKFKLYGLLGVNAPWADLLLLLASIPRLLQALFTLQESEDCLFLNVFTPAERLPAKELRPVLVFIHGGGFVRGSAHSVIYGPDFLVARDMVVVTFNYRLGAFGFLSSNTSDAPGNAGLKDQTLALKWVRENIENFGGDPERVTIYGESAGAASAHLHVLSPMSRGLFDAAIISSSSALSAYVMTQDPVVHSEMLARELGAAEDVIADPRRRVEFIRSKSSSEVSKSFTKCLTEEDWHHIVTKLPFGAVVERCDDDEEHFLCERPEDILRGGHFNKVPMIFGINTNEGTLINALDSIEEVKDKINTDVTTFIPRNLNVDRQDRHAIGCQIQQFYIHPEAPNDTTTLVNLYGDIMISHGVHVAMKWHTIHSTKSQPLYIYFFDEDSFGFYKFIYGVRNLKGPGHADELGYIFNMFIINDEYIPNREKFLSTREKLTELISNFVHERRPTSERSKNWNISWPPATPGKDFYLHFGDTLEIKTDLLKDRMQFWDSVYSQITHDPVYK